MGWKRHGSPLPQSLTDLTRTLAGLALIPGAVLALAAAPEPTATQLASSLGGSTFGQPVTFTALVTRGPQQRLCGSLGTVTFLDRGVPLGTVPVRGGMATLDTASLSVATHTLVAAFSGGEGCLPSSSSSLSLTVDAPTTPPVLRVSALPDGAVTTSPVLNISGTATSPSGLRELRVNGAEVPVDPGGAFSWPLRFREGENTIRVEAVDRAGLTAQNRRTVVLASRGPTLTLSSPPDNLMTSCASVEIQGSIQFNTALEAAATVTCSINGGIPRQALLNGNRFQLPVSLEPGLNTLQIQATSTRGATVNAKRTVTAAPGFTLALEPLEDRLTVLDEFTLKGSVADAATPVTVKLTLNGKTYAPPVVEGRFEQLLPLPVPGVFSVAVDGADAQGVTRRVRRNFLVAADLGPTFYTQEDVARVLQIVNGLVVPTEQDLRNYDVAPLRGDFTWGDGRLDIDDAAVVVQFANGVW